MAKILFVDDRLNEVIRQWELSGCASNHELLRLEPFDSIERTYQIVNSLKPDIVIIGYGLGKSNITGADVVRSLRKGEYGEEYSGYIIANSGGGVEQFYQAAVRIDGTANRKPHDLKMIVDNLFSKRSRRNE